MALLVVTQIGGRENIAIYRITPRLTSPYLVIGSNVILFVTVHPLPVELVETGATLRQDFGVSSVERSGGGSE